MFLFKVFFVRGYEPEYMCPHGEKNIQASSGNAISGINIHLLPMDARPLLSCIFLPYSCHYPYYY